jgi:hypothetical protein
MSPAYVANVVASLKQGAHYFHAGTARRLMLTVLNPGEHSNGSPGAAYLLAALHVESPEGWLEKLPLMRALRVALARSGSSP